MSLFLCEWGGSGRVRWLWFSRSCPFSPIFLLLEDQVNLNNNQMNTLSAQLSKQAGVCTCLKRLHIHLSMAVTLSKSELRDLPVGQSSQFMYTVDCLLVAACLFVLLCTLLCHHLWYKNQGEMKHSYPTTLSIIAPELSLFYWNRKKMLQYCYYLSLNHFFLSLYSHTVSPL